MERLVCYSSHRFGPGVVLSVVLVVSFNGAGSMINALLSVIVSQCEIILVQI